MIEKIDALLPQTQCGECGFSGCRPYAEALAQKTAQPNLCPPGGLPTLIALGRLLNTNIDPWLQSFETRKPATAIIREKDCIGCTKCIQACPVDAIIGSAGLMHAVIPHECTGCGLCVEPCPVDCIEILPVSKPQYQPDKARQRHQARRIRKLKLEHEQQQSYRQKRLIVAQSDQATDEIKAKQDYILKAIQRVKAKKVNKLDE